MPTGEFHGFNCLYLDLKLFLGLFPFFMSVSSNTCERKVVPGSHKMGRIDHVLIKNKDGKGTYVQTEFEQFYFT